MWKITLAIWTLVLLVAAKQFHDDSIRCQESGYECEGIPGQQIFDDEVEDTPYKVPDLIIDEDEEPEFT